MPSPGPGGSQSSLAGMVVSWLTSQFRTGRSSRKLAVRLDGKWEPDYHVERADAAAAWRRHFQTAAFLLERGTQFLRALREGVRADGANYLPVFPYPSFTGITDGDVLAIKTYLFSLPPVHRENRPHDVAFPFS